MVQKSVDHQPAEMKKHLVNNFTQTAFPQLVNAGFLNHQQYVKLKGGYQKNKKPKYWLKPWNPGEMCIIIVNQWLIGGLGPSGLDCC